MTNTAAVAPSRPEIHPDIRDETEEMLTQGYRLIRVIALGGFKLRAEARWDTYEKQSFASVSVLSSDLRWTHLASTPTAEWYGAVKSRYAPTRVGPRAELGWVLDALVARASLILF